MTVFNYSPTKEDLVFGRMVFFDERLAACRQSGFERIEKSETASDRSLARKRVGCLDHLVR